MIQRRPRRCQHKTGNAAALCEMRTIPQSHSAFRIPHSAARPRRPRGVKVSQWRSRRRHRMRQLMVLCVVGAALVAASRSPRAATSMPDWAYAIPQPPPAGAGAPAAPPDTSPKQLPGSTLTFTRQQISDGFGPADWFPSDHPRMPEIVAHGKRPDVRACGLCHYPNGKGRQENAGVAGLPVSYFIQTMNDFRDGLRKSAESRKANTNLMIQYAKTMTADEIKEAAQYLGAMPWTPRFQG